MNGTVLEVRAMLSAHRFFINDKEAKAEGTRLIDRAKQTLEKKRKSD